MALGNLAKRLEQLERQVQAIQATLESSGGAMKKDWRRAVDKYAGDADLLAVFAEAQRIREASRNAARQSSPRRPKP